MKKCDYCASKAIGTNSQENKFVCYDHYFMLGSDHFLFDKKWIEKLDRVKTKMKSGIK